MNSPFDEIAPAYDRDFTNNIIARELRDHVMLYVENQVLKGRISNILEINCGTGADALRFHAKGHQVLATDISRKMIEIARNKLHNFNTEGIEFRVAGFYDLDKILKERPWELLFSNFGGLNCIAPEELKTLFERLHHALKPNARIIGVVMPKFSLWEIFYFHLKGSKSQAFRRNSDKAVNIRLGGQVVPTWYYSPRMIKELAGEFRIRSFRPIGIALPPSSLEPYFIKHRNLLRFFSLAERAANNISFLSGCADHFLFDLEKR